MKSTNRANTEISSPEVHHKEMFDTMIQNSPACMYILEGASFLYVNRQLCELTGYTEDDFISGRVKMPDLICPEDLPIVLSSVNDRLEGRTEEARYRVRVCRKDGSLHHIEVHASKMIKDGKAVTCGTIIDVTEQVMSDIQLQENQERFESLFYNNPDAIFKFDLEGKFTDFNPACSELVGYSAEKLLDMSFAPLVVSEDLVTAFTHFQMAAQGIPSRYELSVMHANGELRNLEVTAFPVKQRGEITGVYGIAKDVTEKLAHEKLMEEMVYFDSLTKLPNRKLFEDRLSQVLHLSKTNETPLAVLFLDVDRFKFINDSLGHHMGDEFLKITAQRLLKEVRKTDTVGRFAGDEFAILLPDANEQEAVSLAKRLNAALAEPFDVLGHSLSVSASIGIAFSSSAEESVDSLVKKADVAMYYTKRAGKNSHTVYTPELDQGSAFKLLVEKGLKTAIQNNEFVLHYQPIMGLKNGKVSSMEALIRWHHPELGLVPPDRFIPVSEESGQIIAIGEWVLRTACSQNKAWQRAGYGQFKISINVSTIQLQRPDFAEKVKAILDETGLEGKWVELEVTESILMEDTERLKRCFKNLKALGLSIAIDDFGTGYTSLSYLREFEFDRVKIDRSFISDINSGSNGKAITSTIIALAHKLNMGVIAEGIEDDTQLSFLSDELCDEGQGYYFSRPMPAELQQFSLFPEKAEGEE
jgi:diguanylate cyclase (GGDEF)-like protein/PAS domain S-box-containing protein